MSKPVETAKKSGPAVTKQKEVEAVVRKETNRDLVEQIVVALILAFLIRGYVAEAFVIPTGSMAPTLMGRHKEVTCQECGLVFSINASDEVEGFGRPSRVVLGTCQNCRAPVVTQDDPSFKGDRILVMKFLYNLPFLTGGGGPNRWDVVVFKYPEEPEVNYIKRLVGLPNEDLRIAQGNILSRQHGTEEPFRLARRPLVHQRAMQMLVYDDRYQPKPMVGLPEWERWRTSQGAGWDVSPANKPGARRSYTSGATGSDWNELRYEQRVPDPIQWVALLRGEPTAGSPRSTLITDFYAYNSNVLATRNTDSFDWYQPHWVGDLTMLLRFQAEKAAGTLRLELVEGGTSNRCEVDLATGQARLFHGETQLGEPVATTLNDTSEHRIELANVDDRITLWVDGQTPFGEGRVFNEGEQPLALPTAEDLQPARVGVKGVAATVSDLVLKRDIYYTLDPGRSDFDYYDPETGDLRSQPYDLGGASPAERVAKKFDALANPSRFSELADLAVRDFQVRPGHYLMMGDNSPRSKDSRGWGTSDQLELNPETGWDRNTRASWEVPENLLIGKAFFIYWPHAMPFGPKIRLSPDFILPFRPYFERMRWIR